MEVLPSPSARLAPDVSLFRTFVTDSGGRPRVGAEFCMLGARVPADIKPDGAGQVRPGRGGMSVTPLSPAGLPPHLRPIALPGGQSTLPVFYIAATVLDASLQFQPDARRPERHGVIGPARAMALDDYQQALADSRSEWVRWRAAA